MLAFPEMLVSSAQHAGIRVPDDADKYDPDQYPHWHVYLLVQLGAPIPWAGAVFDNAAIIASISDDEIKTITYNQLIEKGLAVGYTAP